MDKITQSNLQALSRAIKEAAPRVKKSALWLRLHHEYGIGQLDGPYVILSRAHHGQVCDLVLAQTGINLLEHLPTGDRIDVARQIGNEKLFSEAPGRHHVVITSHCGQLTLNERVIPLLPGSSCRIDWRNIAITAEAVIVIENLKAFDCFHLANIPGSLSRAWALYRGHDVSSQAVKDFLAQVPDGIPIIAFSDYDPAGLIISRTTTRVTHFLLPDRDAAFQKPIGNSELFKRQHASVTHLINHPLPPQLTPYFNQLQDKQLCVSQEQMLGLAMPLVLVEARQH